MILNIRLELNVVDGAALTAAALEAFARSESVPVTPPAAVADFKRHLSESPCSAIQQLLDPPMWLAEVPGITLEAVSVEGSDLHTNQG
jgi:hypothetical protein